MPSLVADYQESQKVLAKLVAKAWLDEEFKKRLLSNPADVLAENGITVPAGAEVRVNENASLESQTSTAENSNSNGVYEIPLPPKPDEFTAEQIQSWADGEESDSPAPFCGRICW